MTDQNRAKRWIRGSFAVLTHGFCGQTVDIQNAMCGCLGCSILALHAHVKLLEMSCTGSNIFQILCVLLLLTIAVFDYTNVGIAPRFIEGLTKQMPHIHFRGTIFKTNDSNPTSRTLLNRAYLSSSEILSVFGDYKFPSPECSNKLLVYECAGAYCGGLADRQKGIMSSFLLAILTNRTLVVDHRKPCDLKKYLEPNLYDWSKCMSFVASARTKGNFYTSYIDGHGNIAKNFSNIKTTDIWREGVVTLHNINVLILQRMKTHPEARQKIPWLFTLETEKQISGLLHVLFKPVYQIAHDRDQYIKNFTKNGQRTMIGVHYRQDFLKFERDFPVFLKFLEQYTDKEIFTIYIATDNAQVKKQTVEKFPNVAFIESGGTKLHVDEFGAKCEGMYYAVLEQQLLSRCSILVVSVSGYARNAAYIRGVYSNIYLLKYPTSKNSSYLAEVPLQRF